MGRRRSGTPRYTYVGTYDDSMGNGGGVNSRVNIHRVATRSPTTRTRPPGRNEFVARLVETYDWDCTITESEAGGARFEFVGDGLVASE